MKWMIASDIHGSAYYCRQMLEAFEKEQAGRLLLLGDILYHGPRNDLPRDYSPKEVIAQLNPLAERIVGVGGNCDADIDQYVLNFPMSAGYAFIDLGTSLIFATHGHVYNPEHPPRLRRGDILLTGHTHVPALEIGGNFTYCNPGSTSIPKKDSARSYMTLENGVLQWKKLDGGEVYLRHVIE